MRRKEGGCGDDDESKRSGLSAGQLWPEIGKRIVYYEFILAILRRTSYRTFVIPRLNSYEYVRDTSLSMSS